MGNWNTCKSHKNNYLLVDDKDENLKIENIKCFGGWGQQI
jgi:hypothetical protein